jgi:carboxyl-terminal processing protease
MKGIALWLGLGVLSLALGQAPKACPRPEPPPEPRPTAPLAMPEEFRRALFAAVWEAVRDFYLYPDYGGADWEALGREYEARVLGTVNAWEVYALLEEMVGKLGDPSTRFISPLVVEEALQRDPTYGGIGVVVDREWAEAEGQGLRVVYVFPNSPAAKAGLRVRDRILAVDGDPCPRVDKIRGPVDSQVRLLLAFPGEAAREVSLPRQRITPTYLPEVGRLALNPAYGHIRLVSLEDPETPRRVEQALEGLLREGGLKGLILDLRRVQGGDPRVMAALLGQFASGRLGSLYTRQETLPLEIPPGRLLPALRGLPLAVLVDGETEGVAEVLAAFLRAHRQAKVVGATTRGQTGGVEVVDFPDNSVLVLRTFGYTLPDGTRLERRGLKPDIPLEADWLSLPPAQDPYFLKALEWLAQASP